jgi:hypothetical protein
MGILVNGVDSIDNFYFLTVTARSLSFPENHFLVRRGAFGWRMTLMADEAKQIAGIYRSFLLQRIPFEDAAAQITDFVRTHQIEPFTLELCGFSAEEQSQISGLLDHLAQITCRRYVTGELSIDEAKRQMLNLMGMFPSAAWAIAFGSNAFDSQLSDEERTKVRELFDQLAHSLKQSETKTD